MLNMKLQQKALKAFRSGKYHQVFGHVIGPGKNDRCAAGLVCELLPLGVEIHQKDINKLVYWNDKCKYTFAQIADKVEAGELD